MHGYTQMLIHVTCVAMDDSTISNTMNTHVGIIHTYICVNSWHRPYRPANNVHINIQCSYMKVIEQLSHQGINKIPKCYTYRPGLLMCKFNVFHVKLYYILYM